MTSNSHGFPDLSVALEAGCRLILIPTVEEDRAMDTAVQVCKAMRRPCLTWDEPVGFSDSKQPTVDSEYFRKYQAGQEYVAAKFVETLLADRARSVFICRSLQLVIKDRGHPTGIRLAAILRTFFAHPTERGATLVLIDAEGEIPKEWGDLCHVIDFPLPRHAELGAVLDQVVADRSLPAPSPPLRDELLQAALGMTARAAARSFAIAGAEIGKFDTNAIRRITQEKKQIIRRNEALEFIPYSETVQESDVAGLDVLKDWLRQRERAFSTEARNFGIDPPKGVLLVGIPGTGKSLTAKMIGGLWRQPLLRLDVGALFNQYVGESERRTREALQLAATVSPCILWIDEIEKGMGPSHERDGGSSQRMLGTVLTWMQERKSPVFVVATSNDASRLPPELKRSGRFDAIFWLGLPSLKERMEAFRVHLTRRKQHIFNDTTRRDVAKAAKGLTGAEIEQVVINAVFDAFTEESDERLPVTPEHLLRRINEMRPLVEARSNLLATNQLPPQAIQASHTTDEQEA